MSYESSVYGFIRFDRRFDNSNNHNWQCLQQLPEKSDDVLLWRGMFNLSMRHDANTGLIHFAAAYIGVEYEWQHWLSLFQTLLGRMYWDDATVHLETEFSGKHVFTWEYDDISSNGLGIQPAVRCEWIRESSVA